MPVSLVHLPLLKFTRGGGTASKKTQEKIVIPDGDEIGESDEGDDLSIE